MEFCVNFLIKNNSSDSNNKDWETLYLEKRDRSSFPRSTGVPHEQQREPPRGLENILNSSTEALSNLWRNPRSWPSVVYLLYSFTFRQSPCGKISPWVRSRQGSLSLLAFYDADLYGFLKLWYMIPRAAEAGQYLRRAGSFIPRTPTVAGSALCSEQWEELNLSYPEHHSYWISCPYKQWSVAVNQKQEGRLSVFHH